MFRILLSFLLFALVENTALAEVPLHSLVAADLPRMASWSLKVIEMGTGREVITAGPAKNEQLVPGSLVKLITAGAVLDQGAGQGFEGMKTTIFHDGERRHGIINGNLFLVGRGQALLTAGELRLLAQQVALQGIRKVTGSIIADESFFNTKGLERSRRGPGYAPAGALGLDLHTVAVTVKPSEPGKPPLVRVEPPNNAVRLAVEARTIATASDTITVKQIDDTSYRVTGNISAGSGPLTWRFALHEPALYAAGTLKTALEHDGVEVAGNIEAKKTPEKAAILAEIEGPALRKLVRDMNMSSINVLADNLLLRQGAIRFGVPGTREKGLKAIKDFLGTVPLPSREVSIADGSGLLDSNRVTTGYMARYLCTISKKEWFEAFRDSLPRTGMDGTLRNLGYRNERFRVKSGRLENVYALAGYGVDAKGRELAFAFIVNAPEFLPPTIEKTGAEVIRYLATGDFP